MAKMANIVRSGVAVTRYLYEWYAYPSRARERPALPTVLNLPVTDNCNARCIMCDVWKTSSIDEIDAADLRKILTSKLFREMRHVGISGGEPTLRKDLADMCAAVVESLPKLRSLSITSHGFHPRRHERFIPMIKSVCDRHDVAFTINFSVDGVGALHNEVRGVPNVFTRVMESIETANGFGVPVQVQCTASSANVYGVERVRALAQSLGADVVFRQATRIPRLDNQQSIQSIDLTDNQKSFLADFMESPVTRTATKSFGRRLFYLDLARRLITDSPRQAPCYFKNEGILISAHGDLFHCSISEQSFGNALLTDPYDLYFSDESDRIRKSLISKVCPGCRHDQSGAWAPGHLMREVLQHGGLGALFGKIRTAARFFGLGPLLLLRSKPFRYPGTEASSLDKDGARKNAGRAVLIGCYGGEHVGDAAILGGVLQRLHRDFGVEHAVVASGRPHRTRRWAASLRTNTEIEVIPYEMAKLRRALLDCDYLVFAGGPLMDLPGILISHLGTALEARRLSIPILVEGTGIGPFRFYLSRLIVRRLLEMASHVRLRTQMAVGQAEKWGLSASFLPDPAFDYLESRRDSLERGEVPPSLSRLLNTDKTVVGINLRPLWRKYASGHCTSKTIRRIEEQFLNRFAAGLEAGKSDVRYIFFPMNPDQYGFSDLNMAFRLADKLSDKVDFQIWEYEPNVDEVCYLLRHVAACVAMRFHACIFALHCQAPTIGIDYGIGQKTKVSELFDDHGLAGVIGVADVTAEWLTAELDGATHRNLVSTASMGRVTSA